MWLNAGCVLHLQVADSIPAQVSGSQSVFCMCAVVVPHPPPLLCSLICSSFFPPQSNLFYSFSGNVSMDRATHPSPAPLFLPPPPLFVLIACSALFLRVIKKPCHLFSLSFPSLLTALLFASLSTVNQTVTIAWKQHDVTSWSGRMWCHQSWHVVTVEIGGWWYWRLWLFLFLCYLFYSYAAPSSRHSARRKPNPSRPMTRWRRWLTRCHPHPSCSTTTGKAASPRCAHRPPPQSEFYACIHSYIHIYTGKSLPL